MVSRPPHDARVESRHQSLHRIREQGFYETVAESYKPYVDALWHNFAGERETWTEQLLDPENITRTVNRLFSFLEGDEEESQKQKS